MIEECVFASGTQKERRCLLCVCVCMCVKEREGGENERERRDCVRQRPNCFSLIVKRMRQSRIVIEWSSLWYETSMASLASFPTFRRREHGDELKACKEWNRRMRSWITSLQRGFNARSTSRRLLSKVHLFGTQYYFEPDRGGFHRETFCCRWTLEFCRAHSAEDVSSSETRAELPPFVPRELKDTLGKLSRLEVP